LVENVQREDLSQIDLVNALTSLKEQGMSLKQIAETMGKSEGFIKVLFVGVNEVKKTPELMDSLGGYAGITLTDIVETKGISDTKDRLEILEQHGKGKTTRSEMRAKVRELKKPATPSKKGKATSFESVKYSVSSDGLTIKLTSPNIKLVHKMESLIKRLFKENEIKILN
jgi:ParB-like chromosome segregation protein Spo0J